MLYQISRNGQMYGPYTVDDLQRYVASGNVLLTDLAKSDEMTEWVTVSQILGQAASQTPPQPAYQAPPAYTAPYGAVTQQYPPASAYAQPGMFPDPPNLSWVLVLILEVVTCGFFQVVYDLVQTLWVKKVVPSSKALIYFIAYLVLWLLNFGGTFWRMIMFGPVLGGARHLGSGYFLSSGISGLIGIGVFVLVILYRFTMKADIEAHFNGPEPIGLQLSGIMTFFFGGLYFQYHFNRINAIKQAARYTAPRPY